MKDSPQQFNLVSLINTLNNINIALGGINKTLNAVFPQATGTSLTATGGSATLPTNPAGFISVYEPSLSTTIKIPYYN